MHHCIAPKRFLSQGLSCPFFIFSPYHTFISQNMMVFYPALSLAEKLRILFTYLQTLWNDNVER